MRKLYFIAAICITVTCCKKPETDYRYKFLGDYSFTLEYPITSSTGHIIDTSYSTNGTITYGLKFNTMVIYAPHSVSIEATVLEDGTFLQKLSGQYWYIYGEFETTNKVYFEMLQISGPNNEYVMRVTGEKI